MKIAFATLYDLRDVHRGSGTYYFMSRELERQGHCVECISPLETVENFATRALRGYSHLTHRKYRTIQDIFVAMHFGKQVTQRLSEKEFDLVLTNDYGVAGYCQTSKPVILYTDAVFPYDYRQNTHPWLANLSPVSVLFSQIVTRRGLSRADLCVFPAHWTAQQAACYGRVLVGKSRVVPFGANLEDPGADIALNRDVSKIKQKRKIDLLYVGTDWERKGGVIALTTIEELQKYGFHALLHVVGKMPEALLDNENLRFYGYLDKTKPNELRKLRDLYCSCDVFILPSKAEGFGIVFAEAAAFGLPSLAFNMMAVSEAIQDQKTGWLLPLMDNEKAAKKFAEIIHGWLENPKGYDDSVRASRSYYENTLNWRAAVRGLIAEIQAAM